MGAAENTRAGVAEYKDKMDQATREISVVAERLEKALSLVSDRGPIGRSQNQDLVQIRASFAVAWQNAKEAKRHAQQSKEPAQTFVNRAFPA